MYITLVRVAQDSKACFKLQLFTSKPKSKLDKECSSTVYKQM